jgi:hypothetical protein
MIEKAGRVQLFSRLNEPILKLLVDSEIPLTLEAAQRLMKRIQRGLRRAFRAAPGQSRQKSPLASAKAIEHAVLDEFGKWQGTQKSALRKAIGPLLSATTIARILYHKFRCGAIHGGKVRIDETKFFAEKHLYWRPLYSEYYGPFQLVEFPASFLAAVFCDCTRNYQKKLEVTRKVPPEIHFEMFPGISQLHFLDGTLLPRIRVAVPK